MKPDYYALLEVSPEATQAEIKRSYYRLARLHHPDLNAQARDEHIKRLNEAYSVLCDEQRRSAYDRFLLVQRQAPPVQAAPRMTWTEGLIGFVREFKKGLNDT